MTMSETMTLIEKTVFLKSVEVLADVPTEALAQVAGRASEVHVDRGGPVFREGEEDHGVYIVVEGLVELRKGDVAIRRVQPGQTMGELFLGEGDPHQYDALALEDSHLLNLRRSDVIDALLEYPEFGLAMVQDLARRHHKLTQRVLELDAELKSCKPSAGGNATLEPPDPASAIPRRRGWWSGRRREKFEKVAEAAEAAEAERTEAKEPARPEASRANGPAKAR
jgi:CRP-like cAMP-binding protein